MLQIFKRNIIRANNNWIRIGNLESALLAKWDRSFKASGLKLSAPRLIVRESVSRMRPSVEQRGLLIRLIREQVEVMAGLTNQIHVFMVTDPQGRVVDVVCDEETLQLLHQQNVGIGSSFAMEHSGINAFSVSMSLHCPVVIEGPEHHLQMFAGWTCVCSPIQQDGEIIGYLDISFDCGTDVCFAALLLNQVVRRVEAGLQRQNPGDPMDKVYERFARFGLTPREKEVGYRWLINQKVEQIAAELYLSEGTVRNMIKRIYAKVEVHGKGEFIHKIMDNGEQAGF